MGKIININKGNLLIASDIHGNWEDYQRIMCKYRIEKRHGKIDMLVLAGDLIHAYPGYKDNSKKILDDLIDRGDKSIITLLGNHEFMHLFHVDVIKDELSFVEPFEEEIRQNREKYTKFFEKMPYVIRTPGGIIINHTGANSTITENEYYKKFIFKKEIFDVINNLNYDKIMKNVIKTKKRYVKKKYNIDIDKNYYDFYNPKIGDQFLKTEIGNDMWEIFFNKNEMKYGDNFYTHILRSYLSVMSKRYKEQNFLVSGHIETPEGYKIISDRQLRIGSSYGTIDSNKVLCVVRTQHNYDSIEEIIQDLKPLV